MNENLKLALDGAAGMALGTFFFGGLWWTIRKALASEQPAPWFLGSLLLRMSVTLAGFYFVSGGELKPLLSCLLGFFIARVLVTRLTRPAVTRPSGENGLTAAQEAHHAT